MTSSTMPSRDSSRAWVWLLRKPHIYDYSFVHSFLHVSCLVFSHAVLKCVLFHWKFYFIEMLCKLLSPQTCYCWATVLVNDVVVMMAVGADSNHLLVFNLRCGCSNSCEICWKMWKIMNISLKSHDDTYTRTAIWMICL